MAATLLSDDRRPIANGRGDLRINGTPVKGDWRLSLERDYVDATTFGDANKTYLKQHTVVLDIDDWKGLATASGSPYKSDHGEFDYDAAAEMYDDDPVVQQILKRMRAVEGDLHAHIVAVEQMRAELKFERVRAEDVSRSYEILSREASSMRKLLYQPTPSGRQWESDDPVKNRKKPGKRR